MMVLYKTGDVGTHISVVYMCVCELSGHGCLGLANRLLKTSVQVMGRPTYRLVTAGKQLLLSCCRAEGKP